MTASLLPKANDVFVGESGAILSGAKVLSSATSNSGNWYYTGQTQESASASTSFCQTGYPRCNQTNDLFIDNVPMQHVGTLAEVGPGKWFFDYTADRIYIGDDPSGKTVETSFVGNGMSHN